jgi:hypothetical protein
MGGWLTPGSAREQADTMVIDAVASALTPYCVAKASDDPNAHVVLTQLKESSSYLRRNIVADSGWATPLGSEDPDLRLAQSCQLALAARE